MLSYLFSDARSCHMYLEPNDCSAPGFSSGFSHFGGFWLHRFCTLYTLGSGLRCRGTLRIRYFTFALADTWLGFVLAMFAPLLLLRFNELRITEWNLSVGCFTRFTLTLFFC